MIFTRNTNCSLLPRLENEPPGSVIQYSEQAIFYKRRTSISFKIILFICCFFIAGNAFSQNSPATVTIHVDHKSLEEVFKIIRKQTGYVFFYNYKVLKKANPVTLNLENVSLDDVLKACFINQPLTYTIEKKTIVISAIISSPAIKSSGTFGNITGMVTDSIGSPLPGALLTLTGGSTPANFATDDTGKFGLEKIPDGRYKLTISHIGYGTLEMSIDIVSATIGLNIVLKTAVTQLQEVVVNTGYQTLPKERATGSFEVVDSKLLNRTVSSNILDHLDGIVSGVDFDNRSASSDQSLPRPTQTFSIRGLSSINANQMPLIVVDNFPYKGDINNLNPNDVESVTVLKDAAAASIWGAQAGNGVLIITTKRGKYKQKPIVNFNSSVSIGTKPDLFSARQISTSDYIGLETSLFNQGYYDDYFANPSYHNYAATSPVVDLLEDAKNGTITQADADAQINALSKQDVRNDLLKYFYKPMVNQQYSLGISGGSENDKYYISGGYNKDKNSNSSEDSRYTLNARNTFLPAKGLEISFPIYFSQSNTKSNLNYLNNSNLYPYAKLADADGNPLDINYGPSASFSDQAISQGLYSYHYSPLSEFRLNQDQNYTQQEIRINPEISYKFLNGFRIDFQYQYDYQHRKTTQDQSDSSYAVRSLINEFTQVNPDGSLTYPINQGDILQYTDQSETDQYLRTELDYNHNISKDSRIDAIAGYEHSESRITSNYNGYYGYNPNDGQVQTTVDYVSYFQMYGLPYGGSIPPLNSGITDQFFVLDSKFANAAYTLKDKYILSGSGRIDQTNLFGANSNKRQKVLWSTGGSWIINREDFYHLDWLPLLKLRATYGFQGNIPTNNTSVGYGQVTSLTPLSTISYSGYTNQAGLNYATLNNVSNPNLTWEKIGQTNLGIDFGTKNDVITGSLEYYIKKGTGLIASYPIDPTSGISSNVGNVANISGNGIDITINSKNLDGKFKWNTRFIFNHNTDKVTKYLVPPSLSSILSEASENSPYSVSPIQGNAIYGVYSLKWAGLDPKTGDPRGYDANGNISENYDDLVNNTPIKNLVYSGSANPTYFGSMMNNFSYKGVGLSVNITYKADFYFHQQSVNYAQLYGGNMLGALSFGADYSKRWQKPGDEKDTYVPSAPSASDNDYNRSLFYQASSVLIQKGDNVRVKDAVLSYDFDPQFAKRLHFSALQVYSNATLNAIIWRANRLGIDPEYPGLKPQKIYSLGLRASFE